MNQLAQKAREGTLSGFKSEHRVDIPVSLAREAVVSSHQKKGAPEGAPTEPFLSIHWFLPRPAIGQTASTRSFRVAYILS